MLLATKHKIGRVLQKVWKFKMSQTAAVPHGAMMACPIAVLSCPPARGVLRLLLAAVSAAIACSDDNVCVSACRLLATAAAIVSLGTKHSDSDSVHKQPLTHVGEALSQQSDRPVFMFVPCATSGKAL